jgi:hypothetical protein
MLRNAERIEEIKKTAMENLKHADNHPRDGSDLDYKSFWIFYRSDIRELLSLINDYETDLEEFKVKDTTNDDDTRKEV